MQDLFSATMKPIVKGLLSAMLLFAGVARASEAVARSIAVPAELASVTSNPELSGIVWSPSLRRYLVVTDDGSLILSANAPKGGPKDHGGGLWHLRSPVGKRPPFCSIAFPSSSPKA
jgi:hypothetical protein